MPKSETLHIRVTPEVRALLERAAEDARRSLSDYAAIALEERAAADLGAAKKPRAVRR
jgi:uncharacterized protein (DUF1778 family)